MLGCRKATYTAGLPAASLRAGWCTIGGMFDLRQRFGLWTDATGVDASGPDATGSCSGAQRRCRRLPPAVVVGSSGAGTPRLSTCGASRRHSVVGLEASLLWGIVAASAGYTCRGFCDTWPGRLRHGRAPGRPAARRVARLEDTP